MKKGRLMVSYCCVVAIAIQLLFPITGYSATSSVDDVGSGTPIPVKSTGDLLTPGEVNGITGVLRGIIHDHGTTGINNDGTTDLTDDKLTVPFDLAVGGKIDATGKVCDSTGCIGSSKWQDFNTPTGINYGTGDVGIGLDTAGGKRPLGKLHIKKTGSRPPLVVSKGAEAWDPDAAPYEIVIGDGNDYWGIGAGTNFSIGSRTKLNLLNINAAGKVGIGTSTPTQQLQITKNFELPSTENSNTGIIMKNGVPFIHDFHHPTGGTAKPTGNNTFLGYNSGNFTMGSTASATYQGSYNIGIGYAALHNNTTGYHNTALGQAALSTNTTGYSNTAIGRSALYANTIGYGNAAIGQQTLRYNTTGVNNVAIGSGGLFANTTGDENVGMGVNTLYTNKVGRYNTAVGGHSLNHNIGSGNTALGHKSLISKSTGNYDTAVGYDAGRYLVGGYELPVNYTTGNANLFIGTATRASADGVSNENVIGYRADGIGSNTVTLGNDSIVTTALKGKVGIGTITPASKLDVAGGIKFGTDTDTCDTTKAGTTRYNATDNKLELCNGTAWGDIGSGGGSAGATAAFHVHKNGTNQVIPTSSYTPLTWSTKEFDTNNDFDLTTGRFTPKVPGKYILTASILSDTTNSGGAVVARIKKNGVVIGIGLMRNGSIWSVTGKAVVIVDANGTTDYFEVEGYVAGGTHTISGSPSGTYFSGIIVDSGDGVLAGGGLPVCTDRQTLVYDTDTSAWMCHDNPNNPVYFQVARAGNQTLAAGAVLVWNKKINDPDNVVDLATGAFVAPRNGVYYLSAEILGNVNAAASDYRYYKNGVMLNMAGYGTAGVSSYKQSSMSMTIPLQVGDRIDVRAGPYGSQYPYGGGYHTRFTGFMLTSLAEAKITPGGSLPACMDGQALIYNSTSSAWECGKGTNTISFQVAKTVPQTITGNQKITWDEIIENNSAGFDPVQNHFKAPEDGTYYFHVDTLSANDAGVNDFRLYKNGVNTRLASYSGNGVTGHKQATMSATLTLQTDDVIDIRAVSAQAIFGDGGHLNTRFSGFMVNRSGMGSHNTTFPSCSNGQRIAYNSTTKNWECAGTLGKFVDGTNPVNAVYTTGNVGIGTTNPQQKLDVLGQLRVGVATYTSIVMRDDESPNGIKYIHADSNNIGFLSGAGTWLTRWDNAGNQVNTGNITAPGFFYLSDRTLKKNIEALSNASDILKIGAKRFDWKKDGKHDIGVIAQEVEQYFPEAVKTGADGLKAVDYPKLVAPLIGITKTQQDEIHELKKALKTQQAQLEALTQAINK